MSSRKLPRYMWIAHFLLEQQRAMSSREVAEVFGISPKTVSEDFSKIRKRPDIIEIIGQKVRCKGGQEYQLLVLHIHPYILDARRYPHRQSMPKMICDMTLTWRDLLTRPWCHMTQTQHNQDMD